MHDPRYLSIYIPSAPVIDYWQTPVDIVIKMLQHIEILLAGYATGEMAWMPPWFRQSQSHSTKPIEYIVRHIKQQMPAAMFSL
jgi:hypothetical protein